MNLNDIIKAINSLTAGYNNVSAFFDKMQDKPLSNQQISDYFSMLRHFVSKYSNSQYNIILDFYESISKGEPINIFDNKFVNSGIQSVAIATEVELSKSGLTDTTLTLINKGIDRDFNNISSILNNDIELSFNPSMKKFMLELTPIIKSKVKKAIKSSADTSKDNKNPPNQI